MRGPDKNGTEWGALWQESVDLFKLDDLPHGPLHWLSVEGMGSLLAGQNDADADVVRLFSVLHDACRQDDFDDPEHGPRAAQLAKEWRGHLFDLSDTQFQKLTYAIAHHTEGKTSSDATIGTCWDSDRLDLGRVGITPCPEFLSTQAAQSIIQN